MNNLLTIDDIVTLTGSKATQRQKQILAAHGIKFVTRLDGKISTTWAAINAVLAPRLNTETQEPDLTAFKAHISAKKKLNAKQYGHLTVLASHE